MLNISIAYNRKLSNLAKIYINDAKYSGHNDSFTFKLAIFYNICSKTNILFKVKIKKVSKILKGLALENCPSNISISSTFINSDQIRYLIRKK